jgi:hypothetical protein
VSMGWASTSSESKPIVMSLDLVLLWCSSGMPKGPEASEATLWS